MVSLYMLLLFFMFYNLYLFYYFPLSFVFVWEKRDEEAKFFPNNCFIELQSILETQCDSHEMIDEALRAYLQFMTSYKGQSDLGSGVFNLL